MRITIALVLVLIVALLAGCSSDEAIYDAVKEDVLDQLKYPAEAEFPELDDDDVTIRLMDEDESDLDIDRRTYTG